MKLKLGSPVVYKLMAGLTIRFLNRGAAAADDDLGTSTIDMPGDGADESSESDDSIDFNDALEP
jgi:hypothetical protein